MRIIKRNMKVRRMNEDHINDMINQEEANIEDKLNTLRELISEFIDDNCLVRINNTRNTEVETEILFDESDGGKILEKNIKTLFNDIKEL